MDGVLCYASGFPDWDADDPATVEAHLPPKWREAVMRDNAAALFRWQTSDVADPFPSHPADPMFVPEAEGRDADV